MGSSPETYTDPLFLSSSSEIYKTQSNDHALPFDARTRARALKEKRDCSQSRISYLSITNHGVKGLTGVLKHVTANELFLSSFSSRMFMLPSP